MIGEPANVAAYLPLMAARQPDRPAVVESAGRRVPKPKRYHTTTFAELDARCDAFAHILAKAGVGVGAHTAVMVPPGVDCFALVFALFKIGAVPVMVDPGMGVKNLGECLAEAEPWAFVGIPKAHVARHLFGWAKGVKRRFVVGGWYPFAARLTTDKRAATPFPVRATEADDRAAILFTSGSTGAPKGAVYTHGMFAAQVRVLREMYGIAPGEIDLPTFPLFALFAPALGMTSVVPKMDFTRPAKADPEEIADCLTDRECTTMFGSPALLDGVGRALAGVKTFPRLKRVITAGAPVRAEILEAFAKLLPPDATIVTPYGATETLPVSSISAAEILSETRARTANGAGVCVGRPAPGVEVSVIGIDDGPIAKWSDDLRVKDGEIGEFVVRSQTVSPEYYNRPDQTALAKIRAADGAILHRMGDVGWRDERGRLWYCGRKSHRVELGIDKTLFTECVEAIFNRHPLVRRTALVGMKLSASAEPVLWVEPKDPLTEREQDILMERLRELGERHELTRDIRRFLFLQEFPVDVRHNAKIFREKLRDLAVQRLW
jgi:acyl-CoA synthetase (AMP-forming)/AMP-acid ligase II